MDVDIDTDHDVPDFVRRPIIPIDPTIYHEAIHPRAIFELRETPSGEYVSVVPYSCTHCRLLKQSCSRLLPCDRCTKTERPCNASQPGYQKLPPPKITKLKKRAPTSVSPPISGMSQTPLAPPSKMIVASRSSQPITTSSNSRSPKKPKLTHPNSSSTPKKTSKCKGNKNKVDGNPLQSIPLKQPVNPETRSDTAVSTAPVWTFVRPPKTKCAIDSCAVPTVDTLLCTPCTPRVWANSRAEFASIFPELTKSLTGILWRQFQMPALFLEYPNPEHSWRDKNTLEVVLEWSYRYGPEVLVRGDSHNITHDERPSDNGDLAARVEECGSVKDSAPSFIPIKSDHLQFNFSSFTAPLAVGSEVLESDAMAVSQLSTPAPVPVLNSPSPTVLSPSIVPEPDTPAVSSSATPQIQPQIPEQRPSEIETLDQCRMDKTPLLVFISRESGLLPLQLPPEYACCCLGLFVISDLNADIDNTVITISKTQKCERVRWRLTLEWKSHPWWIDPVEKDADSVKTPRDLSALYFSFLPLDLLAGFKPSEYFPRGWYCRDCGMLNAQRCFRHQICQSSRCKGKVTTNDSALICHTDPLQALRGPHHRLPIRDPLDYAPSSVGKMDSTWDDMMRNLTYQVNSGVRVQHVFTGNQEILQQDATKLLLDVQKDVILSRSDLHSPYFTWSTKLNHEHICSGDPAGQPEIPRFVSDIQDILLHYMQAYGEINNANINHIMIQAWATPGSRRGAVFNAKSHVVTIICLGAEVVMNLVPKRGFTEIPIENAEDRMEIDGERILSALQLVDNGCSEPLASAAVIVSDDCRQTGGDLNAADQPDPASLALGEASGPSSNNVGDGKPAGKRKGTGGKKSKQAPLELSVTLVHGDAIILEGDDFEYQIKRSGTTILLIGSYE
ncbi:hypothetical protein DFJ58DRAFT_800196 [Suillus subalutaceus]|uniref:uncharacterized protein n=1 Tax=Suillus subalutaceus TaxID=48586 RepID=UPI001B85E353|nr:uncharacterized protein DFJ58DRAFT_800196 [Suillus subalutaceus]KAG1845900.1 hypothetical protein DFJ58DRAFT_800196 [Suillus subalutaceus]